MAPKRKENADYCKKYREKHREKYRNRDKERKQLERDLRKYVGNAEKYEEFKRKDRERKEKELFLKKVKADETVSLEPVEGSSSFKHSCTKSRSLKRAEEALPASPNKRNEVIGSLAKKFQLRILPLQKKPGRTSENISEEQTKWLLETLDRSDITCMNPGKNDNVYVGKVDGERQYIQKRYLLWSLREVLEIINGNFLEDVITETYEKKFGKKLQFAIFYRFIKMHKEYVYNRKIPHNSCLCEICENATLLATGINKSCKKDIPDNPHSIVETYVCVSDDKECMMGGCESCAMHNLMENDFHDISESSESEDGPCSEIKFLKWAHGDDGYLTKIQMEVSINEALQLWQETIIVLKKHIYTKRQQNATYNRIKENLTISEVLINVDYSENYHNKQQQEIQSAYFGNSSFSIFTACAYYRDKSGDIQSMPITVTTEANDKSRSAAISCVDVVIKHVEEKLSGKIDTIHIYSDGCSAQFRSRFVFRLLCYIQLEKKLVWHYNERHHGKGPMDGVGGTIKSKVFRKVLAGQVIINTPEEFATVADEICDIDSLFLPINDVIHEPDEVKDAQAIPNTLQIHKFVRHLDSYEPHIDFFYLSTDAEPFHTQWYGLTCGHKESTCDDNTCAKCFEKYAPADNKEWLKCPLCEKWYHELCFHM